METHLLRLIFGFPSIIIAFTVHEFFHAFVAFRCGDPTAKYENRITLNPLSHVEPVGGLLLILTLFFSPFVIGWGKPVPVNENYLSNPRRDGLIVSFAGPLSNISLAAISGLFFKFGFLQVPYPNELGLNLDTLIYYFLLVNLGLGLFNLLPVPPLDGWKILQGILPWELSYKIKHIEMSNPMVIYIILAVIVLTPLTNIFLRIPYEILFNIFTSRI